MSNIKFVKKVLKRVIKEKQDNLIRLKFDFYYADKLLRKHWNEQAKYEKMKSDVEKYEKEIATERAKSYKQRDKKKIIDLEDKVRELKDDIKGYEREIQRVTDQKKQVESLIVQAVDIITELKRCLLDKQLLKFLSKDEKEDKDIL